MKVFKIVKYHTVSRYNSYWSVCHLYNNVWNKNRIQDYKEDMDLCKNCRKMNFRYMVNKLKGKGSY